LSDFQIRNKQAAVGFEPTNNGFANRPPATASIVKQSTCENQEKNLALLTAKDPDLATIITTWPNLPDAIKAAIKALIQTQSKAKV